ncbi:MAG: Ig-like domain-containing protein, partial [bacterium]
MKRFKARQTYHLFMLILILSVFFITGCGGGENGHWLPGDTIAPTVSSTVPANAATGVAINSAMAATFSEVMDPATITTTTFTLQQGATAVSGAVTYAGVTAVFTPASNLAANTLFTATITTGVKDLAGNALASDYVWSFTTGAAPDTTAPTVSSTIPVNAAT